MTGVVVDEKGTKDGLGECGWRNDIGSRGHVCMSLPFHLFTAKSENEPF